METTQKALSMKQPWAYLIASGIKDIENRTWKCPEKYIGQRVLIHASKKIYYDSFCEQGFPFTKEQWKEIHHRGISMITQVLNTSSIIGSVEIVDCVINHPSVWAEKSNVKWMTTRKGREIEAKPIYNWVLANPILFDEPFLNVKGMLGFWNYTPEINSNEVLSTK